MKRKTLISSILTIALCLSLIAGSTYALFTSQDEVNIAVTSGKVSVEAVILNNTLTTSSLDVVQNQGFANGGTALFTDSDNQKLELTNMTPGDKVEFQIQITNTSNVKIQYRLTWVVEGDLYPYLVATADDVALVNNVTPWAEWAIPANGSESKTIDVSVELPAEVENVAQEKSATISFKIEAVQANAIVEEVANADQLWAALEMGVDHITLIDDITFDDGKSLVIDEGVTVELALNGNTITNPVKNAAALINHGELTISGEGAIVNGVNDASYIDDKGNTVKNASKTIENFGKLVINGGSIGTKDSAGNAVYNRGGEVTINGGTFASRGESAKGAGYAAYAFLNNGGTMVINDATVVDPTHGLFASYDGTLTVNGGNYTLTGEFACYVTYTTNGTITINGGNINVEYTRNNNYMYAYANGTNYFKNNVTANGFVTLLGGTYSGWSTIANYVSSEYYQAYDNGNGTWTIAPAEGVTLVDDVQELTTALTTAAAAGAGDSTVLLSGNIDLTGTTWTPISVDGYHGAGVVTVEGNGATITGLTAPLFAGGFAGKSGIIIKNLTIADSTIAGGTQGGGAFIDCADSMHVITLENCHLVDSTVTGERTGGLIGWCSGYAKLDDGPVKANVTIKNCSVTGCEIIGAGSAAGIAGHPGASDYTYTTIENCSVKDTTIHSNDNDSWRVGAIVGTANNGHVVINNCTVENVAISQINKTAPAGQSNLFGRFVPSGTGTLVIDGVNYVANATDLQAALDSAVTGTTIQLLPGVNYGALAVRPTANNETTMYCETHNFTTTDAEEFKAHLAESGYHTTPKYTTTFKDVTIIGAEGATITGFDAFSGHAYGDVYDYVRDMDFDVGSAYYLTLNMSNLTFKDVAFTGQVNINTSDAASVYDGVTFDGCSFTTGGTTAAIRYYNEANNGNVKNITVNDCTFTNCYQGIYVHHVNGITVTDSKFDTTGHNAIAMQGHDGAVALKNVVITGNTFDNIGDRVIRFNEVGADSNITIQNNTATNSGDDEGEVMKATSIASGVTTSIKNNNWGDGKVVANDQLKDQ